MGYTRDRGRPRCVFAIQQCFCVFLPSQVRHCVIRGTRPGARGGAGSPSRTYGGLDLARGGAGPGARVVWPRLDSETEKSEKIFATFDGSSTTLRSTALYGTLSTHIR